MAGIDIHASRPKIVFMYSGQGSQHFQMARALFDANAVFRASMRQLDASLRELGGASVLDALYAPERSRGDPFESIALTHPAIFMIEVALTRALDAVGVRPDMTLGTSLGSFAAAVASGCVEAETMLAAVVQQAAALEACCDAGTMIAVLAEPAALDRAWLAARCEIAAYNLPAHFVVSLPQAHQLEVESHLRTRGVAYQRLPVSYAFHSSWIDAARMPFESYSANLPQTACATPLFCCDRVGVLERLPADFLWQVVRRPIRLQQAVAVLQQAEPAAEFVDLGPSGTLATFLRHLLPRERRHAVHAILSPYGNDRSDLAAFGAALRARH